MPERTIAERAASAEVALRAYRDDRDEEPGVHEDAIGDLVTDLLHLAVRGRLNVDRILRCARRDYEAGGGDARLDDPFPVHLDRYLTGPVRAKVYQGLRWHNARTLGDVVSLSKKELLDAPGSGPGLVDSLGGALDGLGLELEPG